MLVVCSCYVAVAGCGHSISLLLCPPASPYAPPVDSAAQHLPCAYTLPCSIDTLKHPYFLYPAEREITGSTAAFRALHARMTARDVVAIARMQLRDATEPRIVALYPQLEDVDAAGKQRTPPGFVAVPLPYADDVRLMKPPAGALSGVQGQLLS